MPLPGQLNPTPRLLLGPGPSDAHPRVLTAMTTPLLGHLDPQFLEIMNETQEMLRQTFRPKTRLTLPISATGMAGMETCLVNLVEPGDKVVVCVGGFFGQRHGRSRQPLRRRRSPRFERPWGEVFELGQIREVLAKVRPKVLCIVHAETSTGAWQPAEQLGACAASSTCCWCWTRSLRSAACRSRWTPGASTPLTVARRRAWVVRRGCRRCRLVSGGRRHQQT